MSGSDEMNLRLWKARASERLGIMKDRERVALQYSEKLKEKYAQHPQVVTKLHLLKNRSNFYSYISLKPYFGDLKFLIKNSAIRFQR